MNKEQIIQIIQANPNLPYEDMKKQAVQAGVPEALFEEAWGMAHINVKKGESISQASFKKNLIWSLIVALLPAVLAGPIAFSMVILPFAGALLIGGLPFLFISRFYHNSVNSYFLTVIAGLFVSIFISSKLMDTGASKFAYEGFLFFLYSILLGVASVPAFYISKANFTPLDESVLVLRGTKRQKYALTAIFAVVALGLGYLLSIDNTKSLANWLFIIINTFSSLAVILIPIYLLFRKYFGNHKK